MSSLVSKVPSGRISGSRAHIMIRIAMAIQIVNAMIKAICRTMSIPPIEPIKPDFCSTGVPESTGWLKSLLLKVNSVDSAI